MEAHETTTEITDMNPNIMNLNPWRTFTGFRDLQREMNRIFDGGPVAGRTTEFPLLNVLSDQNGAVVTAELPGVDPGELDVSLVKGQLFIRGNVKDGAPQGEGVICHRRERMSGPFSRTIALPYEVEDGKVLAKYDKGVLTITLPRAEKTKPKTIPVIAG
jgi:HSP20 family protein